MNIKTVLGLLVAIVVLVGAFFLANHKAAAPVLETPTATSTMPTATSSAGTSIIPTLPSAPSTGAHSAAPKVMHKITVDQDTLTAAAGRPTVTGTATNLTSIGYVLDNPQGVGIMGSASIPVVSGRWSITPPQALTPGTYTLHLISNGTSADYTLTITN